VYLDTSRFRFDPAKHYSAVLLQQGRVILDSDVAEESAILQHYLRTAIADIVGPAGCPAQHAGFEISATSTNNQPDLAVSAGRMYVGGILAETDGTTYLTQPDGYVDPDLDPDKLPAQGPYVVYLRVWERSVTFYQDPDIREVALGIHGPDTAGRAQVVWQITFWSTAEDNLEGAQKLWQSWIAGLYQPIGKLRAQAKQPDDSATDICSVSPQAQYRGRENQLYRVEIFRGGAGSAPAQPGAGTGPAGQNEPVAQYVWSRENGSVVFAIQTLAGAEVTLASLGRDLPSGLEIGDWVEIVDDASASRFADDAPKGHPRALFQVMMIDPLDCVVTLDRDPSGDIGSTGTNPARHPLLRRWDAAMAQVTEGDGWLDLEDGVQVSFPGTGTAGEARYRTGDYWLIPARTVLGDVIWPQDSSGPKALPPAGVAYYYAPLALVHTDHNAIDSLRPIFNQSAHWPPQP
jgi:hypothetical protein